MEENWFIFKEDHHLGPFSADALLTMLEDQEVSENVLVWKEGFDAWLPLKECPEFQVFEEDEGPPPLPPLPIEEEIHIAPAAVSVDELMSDAGHVHPEDLQPEVDPQTAEQFWSEVDENEDVEPRFAKAEKEINPLEYSEPEVHESFIQPAEVEREILKQEEIDEVVEEHAHALEDIEGFDDEEPPPLPPLPVDDYEEADELEEQEYLFEQTDVYENEVTPSLPEEESHEWTGDFEEIYESDEVHPSEEEEVHALDEVEAEQAQREKRADFLIHSAWAAACLAFILISLYLVFGIEQRREQFTGLTKKDFTRLTNVAKKATSGSLSEINFDVGVGTDLQTIWVASNRKGPAGLFLSMKSVENNVLGLNPVLINSTGELNEGVGVFDKFEIVDGDRVSPGLYNFHLKVYDTSLKHKFFLFLKKVPLLGGLEFVNNFKGVADFNKQILMYDGSLADFKTKLAEFKKRNKEFKAKPIRQRIEAYSTLTNLSKKIFDIYSSSQSKLKRGKDIREFEKVYGRQVSPLLQGIILDNIKKQRRIRNQNPDEEKEYDKLVMFGRKVGEFAADIVTEHRSLKKLSNKRKRSLKNKYSKTLTEIEKEGRLLESQSKDLLRNL